MLLSNAFICTNKKNATKRAQRPDPLRSILFGIRLMISYQFIAFGNDRKLAFFFQLLQSIHLSSGILHTDLKMDILSSPFCVLCAFNSFRLNFDFDLFSFIFPMFACRSPNCWFNNSHNGFWISESGLGQHLSASTYMINGTITCFMQMWAK